MDCSVNLNDIDLPLKHVMKSCSCSQNPGNHFNRWRTSVDMQWHSMALGFVMFQLVPCNETCFPVRKHFYSMSKCAFGSKMMLFIDIFGHHFWDTWDVHQEWVYNLLYGSSVWACMGHEGCGCALNVPRIMWKKCEKTPWFSSVNIFATDSLHVIRIGHTADVIAGRVMSQSDCPCEDLCFYLSIFPVWLFWFTMSLCMIKLPVVRFIVRIRLSRSHGSWKHFKPWFQSLRPKLFNKSIPRPKSSM